VKVLLLKDIENIGKEGSIVTVADGFARNYLIPKKIGIDASEKNRKTYENQKRLWDLKSKKEIAEAEKIATEISKVKCRISRKVGDQDRLFGSVTSLDIVDAMKKQKFEIDKRKILLEEPIKSIGNFKVPIKLHSEVIAYINLEVLKEE
jgi:large subunit ribosomal protein L9